MRVLFLVPGGAKAQLDALPRQRVGPGNEGLAGDDCRGKSERGERGRTDGKTLARGGRRVAKGIERVRADVGIAQRVDGVPTLLVRTIPKDVGARCRHA